MYQFISAIVKPLNGDGHWKSVDIGNMAINVLFSTYSKMWAILSNPFLTAPVALDLELIRADHGGKSITFNALLTSLGNITLPTQDTIPQIKPRYVQYRDAMRVGYKVQPIHPTYALDAQLPAMDKPWLHMSRPDTDYNLFYKSCLVTVNGFYHMLDAGPDAIYVIDGNKSAWISKENEIGFLSFANIGSLSYVPITKDMVYKQRDDQIMAERAYVDIGQDVTNKTVMLVLGGYLHVLDDQTFTRVGDSLFMIDFANLPLYERLIESSHYLDLSSLGLSKTDANPAQYSTSEVLSDTVLTKYLMLSQSFFVVLDNPDIFAESVPLAKSRIPNIFLTDEKPVLPMYTGVGRMANYWSVRRSDRYALYCTDTLRPRPLYRTTNPAIMYSFSDQNDPQRTHYQADAFFLKIGTDLA